MTLRLRSVDMELKDRVKALRDKLGLTQEQLAAQSIPEGETKPFLRREEIAKIEQGDNQGGSSRVREGLAAGFGLQLPDAIAFIKGRITVDEALRRRWMKSGAPKLNRDLPGWMESEAKARAILFSQAMPALEGYHFMGARLMPALVHPVGDITDVMFVTGWAWIFKASAEADDVERAKKAEAAEHGRSPKLPPAARK